MRAVLQRLRPSRSPQYAPSASHLGFTWYTAAILAVKSSTEASCQTQSSLLPVASTLATLAAPRQARPHLQRAPPFRERAALTVHVTARASHALPSIAHNKQMVRDTIELTPAEQELFATLLAAVQHANSGTILRCAGGWVRDKLLGKESADIDIALDNMLGRDFAELVNQYLSAQGKQVRTAAVIQANPDQSKHLETARMKIGDTWIDLVNLRSETYASESRIPTMEFGTPKQDAMRRDFTINSLFYNINEAVVEDFTGLGLEDLRRGLIRTPLKPQVTFLDDPLRVLRAVRFATRFGFELHADISEAAATDLVRTALGQKVSKERIGTELEGMFNGRSPVDAVQLLHSLSLLPVVLAVPPAAITRVGADFSTPCVECMRAASNLLEQTKVELDLESRRVLLLAALLLPLRLLRVPTGAKGKLEPVSQHIIRESIKWRAKDADVTQLLHETAPTFLEVYYHLVSAGGSPDSALVSDSVKLLLAKGLRKLKQHWPLGVMLAPISAIRDGKPLGVDPASGGSKNAPLPKPPSADDQEAWSNEVMNVLMTSVKAFGLEDCWQWKPLLDGKQALAALGLQKTGPELGKIMEAALEWRLLHPAGTADLCKQYLIDHWKQ